MENIQQSVLVAANPAEFRRHFCTCIAYMYNGDYCTCMNKPNPNSRKAVREPAQVYLDSDDSELLARLAFDSGLSKAEVMRQGIRSFSREQARSNSPMLAFLEESKTGAWPANVAAHHDEVLAQSYRPTSRKKR